ncbi:hypothetical protein ACWJKU_12580 [Methylocaldum sp. MU1018]
MLLHVLFIRLQLQHGPTLELTEDELNKLSMEMDIVAQKLVEVTQAIQWNKQARSIFENRTDCRTLKDRLMAALA